MILLRHLYNNEISNIVLKLLIRRTIVTKDKICTSLVYKNQCKNGLSISHKKTLLFNRMLGTSFPKITDFTNCRDYLKFVISDKNFKIVPNDWVYLLDQILETLPAESSSDDETNNGGKVSHNSTRVRRRTKQPVKPYYCHSFTLSVCEELGDIRAALALLEYMKMSNEPITHVHRNYVFSAFKRRINNFNDQEEAKLHKTQNLNISDVEEEELLKLCDDVVSDDTETSTLAHERLLINVASTLAYTKRWMDGYDLWNKLSASKTLNLSVQDNADELFSKLHNCAKELALTVLQNDREDLFWTIINDPSFHLNYLHIRDGLHGNLHMQENMKIFIHYVKNCKVKYQEKPVEAFDSISQLFEYFRKHHILVSLEFCNELENMFLEKQLFSKASRIGSKLTCVRVKQIKHGTYNKCKSCDQTINSPHLSQNDFDLLKDNVIKRLIVQDDVYKSTDPKELQKFEALLSRKSDHDIVVDGLNVCGLATKWVRSPNKAGQRVYNKGVYEAQSFILVTVLRMLRERGFNVLLIHRNFLKKLYDYKEISQLCRYVILDDTSVDDPFFIAAAINSGPKTYILTNDLLRQHNFALKDPYLQQIFTYWQMQSQVKCKWLAFKGNNSKEKWLYNESDGVVRTPRLFFPDNRVIKATRTNCGWHIPIAPKPKSHIIDPLYPDSMIRPSDWACIS
jgi:hypothetical protein